jgi:SWI/SNF-related matrix-associated actin-dependent regulator 1 of chromatin subfamily A
MARALCKKELSADGNAQYIFEDFEVMSDFQIHETCEKYESLKKFKLKKNDILQSGKFKLLDTLIPQLLADKHRIVLFSQFVIMMDIMERYFTAKGFRYLRLD